VKNDIMGEEKVELKDETKEYYLGLFRMHFCTGVINHFLVKIYLDLAKHELKIKVGDTSFEASFQKLPKDIIKVLKEELKDILRTLNDIDREKNNQRGEEK
jgi:hypothetical protein